MNDFFIAIILGVVEGVTEFLPISSTGHLIVVNELIGFEGDFASLFEIVVQLGAIAAVIVFFFRRLFPCVVPSATSAEKAHSLDLWKKVLVAVLPALVLGKLFADTIDAYMLNSFTVACALALGGIALIWIERRQHAHAITTLSQVSYRLAAYIGLIQCLALIPGTSRSGATIVGALLLGLARPLAAEFSFFLAIPTLLAASGYALFTYEGAWTGHELLVLAVGMMTAAIVAWIVIRAFMQYISRHNFSAFGWYRIILAIILFITIFV